MRTTDDASAQLSTKNTSHLEWVAVDNAHHLLIGALKVAPPATHPPRPFHGGGPQPKIDAEGYVVAALWLADRVQKEVDPRDKQTFDEYVALARRQLSVGTDNKEKQKDLYSADAKKASRIPCKVGIWTAHEAANWAFRPIYAGGAARPAAANVARFLLKNDPAALPSYLADLDALCIHLEATSTLRARRQAPKGKVVATPWRGITDGKVSHWLMRLAGNKLALLAKQGTRWQLIEGTDNDVLANVPDTLLEAAAAAAIPPAPKKKAARPG